MKVQSLVTVQDTSKQDQFKNIAYRSSFTSFKKSSRKTPIELHQRDNQRYYDFLSQSPLNSNNISIPKSVIILKMKYDRHTYHYSPPGTTQSWWSNNKKCDHCKKTNGEQTNEIQSTTVPEPFLSFSSDKIKYDKHTYHHSQPERTSILLKKKKSLIIAKTKSEP